MSGCTHPRLHLRWEAKDTHVDVRCLECTEAARVPRETLRAAQEAGANALTLLRQALRGEPLAQGVIS